MPKQEDLEVIKEAHTLSVEIDRIVEGALHELADVGVGGIIVLQVGTGVKTLTNMDMSTEELQAALEEVASNMTRSDVERVVVTSGH